VGRLVPAKKKEKGVRRWTRMRVGIYKQGGIGKAEDNEQKGMKGEKSICKNKIKIKAKKELTNKTQRIHRKGSLRKKWLTS